MKSLYKTSIIALSLNHLLLCHASIKKSSDLLDVTLLSQDPYLVVRQKTQRLSPSHQFYAHVLRAVDGTIKKALTGDFQRLLAYKPRGFLEVMSEVAALSLYYRTSHDVNSLKRLKWLSSQGSASLPPLQQAVVRARILLTVFELTSNRDDLIQAQAMTKSLLTSEGLGADEDVRIFMSFQLLRLFHITGESSYSIQAKSLLKPWPNTLNRWEQKPLRLTVVGSREDNGAQRLFKQAMTVQDPLALILWWDPQQEPKPLHPKLKYPILKKPAVYICTDRLCSLPIFDPAQILPTVQRLVSQSS